MSEINFLPQSEQGPEVPQIPQESREFSDSLKQTAEARQNKVTLSEDGASVDLHQFETQLHNLSREAVHNEVPTETLPKVASEREARDILNRWIEKGDADGDEATKFLQSLN